MRIAVEVVPRNEESLAAQLADVARLSRVDAVNVPDLTQFELKGWQAALRLRASHPRLAAVPHVRAMEVELHRPWTPGTKLEAAGVNEILVVTGDPPASMARPITGAHSTDVIRAFKAAHPGWRVYAALDPYRSGFSHELDYAVRKLEAGADGFFTQPLFDVRLMGVWRELLPGVPVFWGVTSVTSKRAMNYWLTRNRAVFPAGFEPTMAWHTRFAAEAVDFASRHDANLYFMPINVDIGAWLGELLG